MDNDYIEFFRLNYTIDYLISYYCYNIDKGRHPMLVLERRYCLRCVCVGVCVCVWKGGSRGFHRLMFLVRGKAYYNDVILTFSMAG